MTAYKRPVFFDRDIKSFSELSADSGLDLGIVARSILADAYLQVGTTGTDGTVSVKNASDAETIKLDGANRGLFAYKPGVTDARITAASNDLFSEFTAKDPDGSGVFAQLVATGDAAELTLQNPGGANTIYLSSGYAGGRIALSSGSIIGLDTAKITQPDSAVNKAYVDSIAQGLAIKGACHVSSQGNIEVLATTTEVDGHTLSEGERVLVRYQANAVENGIYRFDGTGLVRSADMADGSHAAGAFTFVQFGTNADQGWVCTADAPADVVGTDALPWTQFSAAGVIEAGDGLQLIGTVMSAKLDGATLSASADGLKVLGLPEMFEVGGLATSADVSAENLNTLTAGRASNAVGLHSHSADYTFLAAASGLAAGQAAIVSASYEAAPAGTTSSGAYVVGVVENVDAGQARIVRAGFCSAVLSGATPGDTYYVQADGSIGTALPTSGRVVFVGVAVSTLDLFVQIRDFGSILA